MLEHDYKDTTFFFMLREKITQKFHIDQNRKGNTINWLKNLGFGATNQNKIRRCKKGATL